MSNSGRRRLVAAREALQGAIEDEAFCRTVAGALSEGGKALLAGNGGGTADAGYRRRLSELIQES